MDSYVADLHIHSRFSRATSKALTPRLLAAWARVKGISVVATGDFTHPGWLQELKDQLVPDGSGLFRLAEPLTLGDEIPQFQDIEFPGEPTFILSAEISSIYKRGGKVRKIHNLVYMPSFEAVESLNTKLAKVGNLASDGRPILGLDSRVLMEMVLDTHPQAFVIPAHIWTPWFSLFGSKSGFDTLEECYGDFSKEIFALETGLSSDPDMNRMLSALDKYTLVSNSDAHSGDKLGREANVFSGERSYEAIYRALRREGVGPKFLGTVEFFPEEGKYHMDGHTNCDVVMDPLETKARGGICPVCKKPLTVGVLNRVMELADRESPVYAPGAPDFTWLIPLNEVVSEILGVGPKTKKVAAMLAKLHQRFGSELRILQDAPAEELAQVLSPLGEAITRMRQSEVIRTPGFDGRYGIIRLFTQEERNEFPGQGKLVSMSPNTRARAPKPASAPSSTQDSSSSSESDDAGGRLKPESDLSIPAFFNPKQEAAIESNAAHVLVLAGPGTGKTHTLIGKINALLDGGVPGRSILAVTFTRRAAAEMRERLAAQRPEGSELPRTDTLHALAYDFWANSQGDPPVLMSDEAARRLFAEVNPELRGSKLKNAWQTFQRCRESLLPLDPPSPPDTHPSDDDSQDHYDPIQTDTEHDELHLTEAANRYFIQKSTWNLADYTDLLELWLEKLVAGVAKNEATHILVDEAQDLSPLQLALLRELARGLTRRVFAIGDPDQSIYGFRGATPDIVTALEHYWPDLEVIDLAENYRSTQRILTLSAAIFPERTPLKAQGRHDHADDDIILFKAPNGAREASWIAERVRDLLGSTSLTFSRDSGKPATSPGDIAILLRFRGLFDPIKRALDRLGLPCAVPEAEAWWNEPRVAAIVSAASRLFGMAPLHDETPLACSDDVLAKGPAKLNTYLGDFPPFDRFFWKSQAYKKLVEAYNEYEGWAGLITYINTQNELELVGRAAEKVRIMSLHAAKGLEFEAIFLPALEDGILPFAGSGFLAGKVDPRDTMLDDAEEARLFYVGLTRAKRRLYLSHAEQRDMYGRHVMLKRSRFLERLPLGSVKQQRLVAKKVRQVKQLNLL